MNPFTKILAGLTGIGGATGAGIGGVYFNSLEKIGNKLKDSVLGTSQEFDESWKSQFTKLGKDNGSLTPSLQKIKEITPDGWKSLKSWCSDIYNHTYKSIFNSKNEKLLEESQKYCIQSIKEKVTEDKLIEKDTSNRESTFKTKYDNLNSHAEKDGILDDTLKQLKAGYSQDTNKSKWNQLEEWCKSNYSKPFKGDTDNVFKLIKKYCVKD
nr:hypothetical protein [Mycoplasma haemocanis]